MNETVKTVLDTDSPSKIASLTAPEVKSVNIKKVRRLLSLAQVAALCILVDWELDPLKNHSGHHKPRTYLDTASALIRRDLCYRDKYGELHSTEIGQLWALALRYADNCRSSVSSAEDLLRYDLHRIKVLSS